MIRKGLLFSALLGMTTLTQAQVNIHIDTQNPGVRVSPNLYGIFYEDINHAADGGLYAELVRNRSFEDNDKTVEAWKTYQGATMTLVNSAKKQLNRAQKNYLEVNFTGKGTSGISNEGFWGINTIETGLKDGSSRSHEVRRIAIDGRVEGDLFDTISPERTILIIQFEFAIEVLGVINPWVKVARRGNGNGLARLDLSALGFGLRGYRFFCFASFRWNAFLGCFCLAFGRGGCGLVRSHIATLRGR